VTRGVVIGKFYPPHRGHHYLISFAAHQVDQVTVIVCHKEGQSIPGETRAGWLREVHPQVNVLVVPDVLPEDDSRAWAEYTLEVLGHRPDVVFTSEDYGDAYASHLQARHVLVDRDRSQVPVSATMIRRDPLAHWDYLEACVRAHYALRVVVVGAESTGTTTLASALAGHYKTAWVPEFGRLYSDGKMSGGSPWRSEEFVFIATEQSRLEDELARACNRILICDTDAFATGIWHERYMGHRSPEVEVVGAVRTCDLYLLTDVDIPFVQDGTRDGEKIRNWMHERFDQKLKQRRVPYLVISGGPERRLELATEACDRLLTAYVAGVGAEASRAPQ